MATPINSLAGRAAPPSLTINGRGDFTSVGLISGLEKREGPAAPMAESVTRVMFRRKLIGGRPLIL